MSQDGRLMERAMSCNALPKASPGNNAEEMNCVLYFMSME